MEELNSTETQVMDNVLLTKEFNVATDIVFNLKNKLTKQDVILISAILKFKNPFRMIDVETVMKDLNICKGVAYKLFQREDFPSINIGKNKQVMVISYILWKMDKKGW